MLLLLRSMSIIGVCLRIVGLFPGDRIMCAVMTLKELRYLARSDVSFARDSGSE